MRKIEKNVAFPKRKKKGNGIREKENIAEKGRIGSREKKNAAKYFYGVLNYPLLTEECYLDKWHGMYLNHRKLFNGKFDFHEL